MSGSNAALTGKTPVRRFDKLKTGYNNLKIKDKLFLQQWITVLIFGAVCLAGIQIAFQLYDELLYNQSAKVLNLSAVNIENELKQIDNLSFSLLAHPAVQSYLKQLMSMPFPGGRSRMGTALTEILWVYVCERNVRSINLIDVHGNQYSGGAMIPREKIGPIVAQAASSQGGRVLIEPFSGERDLIYAREIREISNLSLKDMGTMIIRVNMEGLAQQATAGEPMRGGSMLIRAGKKEIFASSMLARTLGKKINFQEDMGYQVTKIGGRSYFVAHTFSGVTGWTYVNILPYDTVFRPIIIMRAVIALIFGLILAGTLLINLHIARSLTHPIEQLSAQIKRVEKGDFTMEESTCAAMERDDEIGALQRDFTIMIRKINTLIQEDYTKQIVIKDTQFRALQAQINPHFLYNTMESINWLAKMNGQREISQMVEALGNLLRSAISRKEPGMITLGQEINLLRDYITIQQMRFGERLRFEMAIEPRWMSLAIPKLTLQPIVENSIRYGLETVPGVCQIQIDATVDGDALVIGIIDNGPGIDPGVLESLARKEQASSGNGIGLKNIHDRLRLIFGERYGIRVDNRPEGGTRVRIYIPNREVAHV